MLSAITMLIADIEGRRHGPSVMQWYNPPPANSGLFSTETYLICPKIQRLLLSLLTPIHKLLTTVLRIILVIVPEHPSDTYVLTMKMEILLEPASNKLLVAGENPVKENSLNPTDHDSHKDGDGDALFQLKSDSLPHAHAQTTKTYYKHRDSRIMKKSELKDNDFRTNSSIQDLPSKISSLSREIVNKLSR
ncbi:hypothetical protein Tco_0965035 [Tanacetum coccineum]